jgi:hypothetical protein
LHLNAQGGKLAGWLCDSWTEPGASGADMLSPRLHWFSKEDEKFHLAKIAIPTVGAASITLGPVDEHIEPRRAEFMRNVLAQWENEYITTQSVFVT